MYARAAVVSRIEGSTPEPIREHWASMTIRSPFLPERFAPLIVSSVGTPFCTPSGLVSLTWGGADQAGAARVRPRTAARPADLRVMGRVSFDPDANRRTRAAGECHGQAGCTSNWQ